MALIDGIFKHPLGNRMPAMKRVAMIRIGQSTSGIQTSQGSAVKQGADALTRITSEGFVSASPPHCGCSDAPSL